MSTVNRTRYFKDLRVFFQHGIVAVLFAVSFAAVPFSAKAETASGLAYGGDITLNVLGIGGNLIDTGPLPSGPPGPNGVAGTGSDSFGPISNSVLFVPVTINALLASATVDLGLLSGAVSYVNPLPLPPVDSVTSATGGLTNVDVGLDLLVLLDLGVTADAIESTSEITGVCGNLTATGSATLVNAGVTVGLNPLLVLPVNPGPDTGIDIDALGLAGVTLLLNEQTIGGDGNTSRSISTNALHLEVNILGLITANIILGHSEAAVNCTSADLSIEKTDLPDPITVGQPLTYTVTVTNTGPGAANEVAIQDTLPAGVTVNAIAPNLGGICAQNGNVITCTWPSIPSTQSRQVVVTVTPNVTGVIFNTAVTGTDDFDNDLSNNTATTTTTVNPAGPGTANLSVTKIANPDPATQGLPLTYTLTVANAGPDAATNVALTDTLPAGLGATAVINPGPFNCNLAGDIVNCTLANLASGGSAVVTITVTPSSAGVIANTAVTGSQQNDPNPGDNTVIIITQVNPGNANLAVSKTANPSPATVGQPLLYILTVSNGGPNPAANVVLTDTLPAGLTGTVSNAGPFTCNPSGPVITCTLANLAPGATAQVVIQTVPSTAGQITNVVAGSSANPDPNPTDNTFTLVTTVNPAGQGSADLSVTKSCPTTATAGLPLSYTLTVANAPGGNTATNVTLTDVLPPGLTVTNITAGPFTCNQASNVITCTLASLASGALAQVVIATVPSSVGVLTNTVSVGSDQTDPNPANNTALPCTTTVIAAPFVIPTLGEWGLALLLGALLILGWWSYPQRRQ